MGNAERGAAWWGLALTAMVAVLALFSGCGTFRGLPSHGGGKRFDEEQRVVAGATRQAVADMDLEELRGKPVKIDINAMAHSASARITWPGIRDFRISALGEESDYTSDQLRFYTNAADPLVNTWQPYLRYENLEDAKRAELYAYVTPDVDYWPNVTRSDEDLNYLTAVLSMKALHAGVKVVPNNQECTLIVLVDVLGTNLSRKDWKVYRRDNLQASCELTYYAVDAKTGELLFPARQTSAVAAYNETSILGMNDLREARSIQPSPPTPLPVDGPAPGAVDEAPGEPESLDAAPDQGAQAVPANGKRKETRRVRNLLEERIKMADYEGARELFLRYQYLAPHDPGLGRLERRIDELNGRIH